MKKQNRACGVLVHPTSFPSPFGIGCLGNEMKEVLSMFAENGIKLWQILPLGPTGYGDSPYSSPSCFAGNELLIDPRSIDLNIEGEDDFVALAAWDVSKGYVDYRQVNTFKLPLLKKVAELWLDGHRNDKEFVKFCSNNAFWLDDYALYRALADKFNDSRWFVWPDEIKFRKAAALKKASKEFNDKIEVFKALQFFFDRQWNDIHEYANSIGIRIIGDVPIFVASDSVDAWTHPELFKFDENLCQTAKAGVPPDAFSADGQLWGNPVYDWPVHEKDDFSWWCKRVEFNCRRCDILRIDHFRGLDEYWEIPAGDDTAANGKWVAGPGMKLLKKLRKFDLIAEDLGVLTPSVYKLLEDSKLPGMRVFEFAFENENGVLKSNHAYLPHNYCTNTVAYTGTHDNETLWGWYLNLDDGKKDLVRRYLQCGDNDIVMQAIRSLLASCADVVIIPLQDIMGLGNEARMNCPSTVGTFNWSWRFDPGKLDSWRLPFIKEMIHNYNR